MIIRNRRILIPATLLLLLSTFACQPPLPELNDPDIRGAINAISASISDSDVIGFMLVDGEVEEDTIYDRAFVTVQRQTRIYRLEGERPVKTSFSQMDEGMWVEVWFTGPVAESDPVQAIAETVLIVGP